MTHDRCFHHDSGGASGLWRFLFSRCCALVLKNGVPFYSSKSMAKNPDFTYSTWLFFWGVTRLFSDWYNSAGVVPRITRFFYSMHDWIPSPNMWFDHVYSPTTPVVSPPGVGYGGTGDSLCSGWTVHAGVGDWSRWGGKWVICWMVPWKMVV
jgi:hypothetical protein